MFDIVSDDRKDHSFSQSIANVKVFLTDGHINVQEADVRKVTDDKACA